MFTTVLGYTFPVKDLSPRAYFEFDYASGDKKRGGSVGTFNQLYPNGHAFLSYIDYIGRQNIISPNAGIAFSPIHDLTLSLQQYFFWRASDDDSIYNKSSAIIRPANGTSARYVGEETDVLATYNFTRHLQGYTGYSYFFLADSSTNRASQGEQLLLCGAAVYVLKHKAWHTTARLGEDSFRGSRGLSATT